MTADVPTPQLEQDVTDPESQAGDDLYEPEEEARDEVADSQDAVRLGLWVSALRCLLVYVIAPATAGVATFWHGIGLIVQVLGAVVSINGARRLWALNHPGRKLYACVAGAVTLTTIAALVTTF